MIFLENTLTSPWPVRLVFVAEGQDSDSRHPNSENKQLLLKSLSISARPFFHSHNEFGSRLKNHKDGDSGVSREEKADGFA
jgi:hypothetical protein